MKIAILDDYQQVAKQSADWSSLAAGTQVDSFADTLSEHDALIRRLEPYDVIIAMRERTRFTAQLLEALPNLKLLVSTGGRNPSIDAEACARLNIALCAAHGAASGQSSTSEV
ncbi:MAG TPA: D-2-hydroxyacid dehydrogenase family protein, partial [Burkholderiales bacterium]|nr:D-2-hydroxyacid dehydrogenase family protein [Burkholderiales bacterium]